jgi:hypothetical protein
MFLACSANMVCAVCVTASSKEAGRSLKIWGPRFENRDIRTRVRKIFAFVNPNSNRHSAIRNPCKPLKIKDGAPF